MRILLFLVFILNVLDAAFTSLVVSSSLAEEANPLMQALLDQGIFPFVFVKLLITVLSILVLWKYRKTLLARVGAWICVIIYSILISYYVICGFLPQLLIDMKQFFYFLIAALIIIFLAVGCSEPNETGLSYNKPVYPVIPDDIIYAVIPDTSEDTYFQDCIECKFYFCPPLDAVWQKEICFDMCEAPPPLYY